MPTVAGLLRERTSATHRRVEAQLDLLDPGLTPDRLFDVLKRFCGFWVAGESAIEEWATVHPAEALALRWARRRRADLFAADLATMESVPGGAVVPCAPPVFDRFGQAEVLGWLYVTEGSTLGGAIIGRHLRTLTGSRGRVPRCFTPYSEGPGPMWQSFKAVLQDFAGDDRSRTGAVTDAAAATFGSLERWLAPVAVGASA